MTISATGGTINVSGIKGSDAVQTDIFVKLKGLLNNSAHLEKIPVMNRPEHLRLELVLTAVNSGNSGDETIRYSMKGEQTIATATIYYKGTELLTLNNTDAPQ